MIKSICDNCASKACIWRAESDTLDPPTTDCPLFVKKSITNADKIRSMTDKELANWLCIHMDCYNCEASTTGINCKDCCRLILLDWLIEEATDND